MTTNKNFARIVSETTTPTGEPGILIECNCGHHSRGNRAILRKCKPTQNLIHGNVNCAHSPWAKAASGRRNGPWAA
jgi:hypothetical protein